MACLAAAAFTVPCGVCHVSPVADHMPITTNPLALPQDLSISSCYLQVPTYVLCNLELQRRCPLYVVPQRKHGLFRKQTRPQCVLCVAQELLENKQGLPLPELMEVCNRQVESDSMVMALRAIAAAHMMACEEGRSWAMVTRDMELAPKYRSVLHQQL